MYNKLLLVMNLPFSSPGDGLSFISVCCIVMGICLMARLPLCGRKYHMPH